MKRLAKARLTSLDLLKRHTPSAGHCGGASLFHFIHFTMYTNNSVQRRNNVVMWSDLNKHVIIPLSKHNVAIWSGLICNSRREDEEDKRTKKKEK